MSLFVICRILPGCCLAASVLGNLLAQGQRVDYFTDNGFGNPSSTLQHPTGETYKGVTYMAYQGPHEDSYVAAYNHATKKWTGPVLAGVNLMGKTPDPVENGELDNHGKPAMMVDSKGYIHVVYGAHGGSPQLGKNLLGTPGSLRGGKLTHVVSKNPEDISSWVVLENISPFGTYPQFVQMDDGAIYLFYRHGAHRSDWVYQKSPDDGRTFRPPVSILKHKPQKAKPGVHDSWYAWFAKGQGDTITASYVYHPCAENPNHTNQRSNMYYMKMNVRDGSWENITGEKLTVSVTKEYADKKTLVLDSGDLRFNHGTCRVDPKGHPHLLFSYDGSVRHVRWTGSSWTNASSILPEGGGDGDLIVESPLKVRAILTSRDGEKSEVGFWTTVDGGKTWAKELPILSTSTGSYDIGALLENYTDDGMIIISEARKADYLYRRMMLVGTNGAVKRAEADASYIQEQLKMLRDSGVEPESKESKAAKRAIKKNKKK